MISVAAVLIVVGYSLVYSGVSQILTAGNGVGFLEALGLNEGDGIGTPAEFVSDVPQGGSQVGPPAATAQSPLANSKPTPLSGV